MILCSCRYAVNKMCFVYVQATEKDAKQRELREQTTCVANPIGTNDFDYEDKQKTQDSLLVYDGLQFNLAAENSRKHLSYHPVFQQSCCLCSRKHKFFDHLLLLYNSHRLFFVFKSCVSLWIELWMSGPVFWSVQRYLQSGTLSKPVPPLLWLHLSSD